MVNKLKPSLVWLVERLNAVVLLILVIWLGNALQNCECRHLQDFQAWLLAGWHLQGLLLLVVILHWHLAKGLQHVMDDYLQTQVQHRFFSTFIRMTLIFLSLAGTSSLILITMAKQ